MIRNVELRSVFLYGKRRYKISGTPFKFRLLLQYLINLVNRKYHLLFQLVYAFYRKPFL